MKNSGALQSASPYSYTFEQQVSIISFFSWICLRVSNVNFNARKLHIWSRYTILIWRATSAPPFQAVDHLYFSMSTRKSTRLESKPAIKFNELEPEAVIDEDAEYAEESFSDSDEGPSRRKRKKTGASSRGAVKHAKNMKIVRGRRGRLRALPYVNLLRAMSFLRN